MMTSAIETLKTWITESDNIVFFGGAGVSTESGIPDFRSTEPCSSYTRLLPAFWCRPSMFCVTTARSLPARSSAASLRCAAFGCASSGSIFSR